MFPISTGSSRAAYRSPLPRLRVGSELTTRKGIIYRVREPVVLVSGNGAESHSVIVERIADRERSVLVLTVGILANQTRGALHKPGTGALIDWPTVQRRPHSDLPRNGVTQPVVIPRASDR